MTLMTLIGWFAISYTSAMIVGIIFSAITGRDPKPTRWE